MSVELWFCSGGGTVNVKVWLDCRWLSGTLKWFVLAFICSLIICILNSCHFFWLAWRLCLFFGCSCTLFFATLLALCVLLPWRVGWCIDSHCFIPLFLPPWVQCQIDCALSGGWFLVSLARWLCYFEVAVSSGLFEIFCPHFSWASASPIIKCLHLPKGKKQKPNTRIAIMSCCVL